MKFTLDWLQEYVNTDGLSAAEIAEHLTMLGLEVDAVTEVFAELRPADRPDPFGLPASGFDHLQICEVAVGPETCRFVLRRPNARKGLVTTVCAAGCGSARRAEDQASKVRVFPSSGCSVGERARSVH